MADGDVVRYNALKGTEETEFFGLFDLHRKKIEEEIKKSKANGK